ncbi:MAG TPA: hypothetical protein VKE94_08585 [Gemmataceae bacterium]|nr:hypothetical protein [Gemmataceae bacterium]
MNRLIVVACGLLLILGVSGCGSNADSLMKEQIKLMNELADALEGGADQAKIEAINTKMKENGEKLEALKLSEADKKKLAEKYKDDMTKVGARLASAMFKKLGNQMGDLKMPDLSGTMGKDAGKK